MPVVTLAAEFVLTEHRAVAVGDRLALHRQLHLDARFCFGVEDGDAHALLHARPEHRGRRDQVAPGSREEAEAESRRARWRKGRWREGKEYTEEGKKKKKKSRSGTEGDVVAGGQRSEVREQTDMKRT